MDAAELLRQGKLSDCQKLLFDQVRHDPSNIDYRVFLFQLACIQTDWKRALSQLEVLKGLSDANLALVNTYKQIIQCEAIRTNVLSGEKEPSCFGEPLDWVAYYAKAYQQYCDGHYKEAFSLITEGAEKATSFSGNIDGEAFNWLCDADLRFGPSIEIMLNGGYYWLPYEYVKKIEFEEVEDLRDLVWRPANLTLKNNGQLIIFVPVRYPIHANTSDEQLLARTCEWQEPLENFFTGHGQRTLLTDEKEYPLLNIKTITFD